jgi:N-6 DNA Methylase
MSEVTQKLEQLVAYHALLKGDEKGEAQVFCEKLFQAFGHDGYKQAGAELEARQKKTKGTTGFVDLIWKPKLILEMKKRGEKLFLHYQQAFDYWLNAVPNRPKYVVLCNFDEFWIYDFDLQLNEPVDKLNIHDLPKRYAALNFLFAGNKKPEFGNNLEDTSRKTADQIADLYQRLITRKIDTRVAQRFVLQLIVAMFAEDIDLLPDNTVSGLVNDCLHNDQSSYDLFSGLFNQMNKMERAKGGRFVEVPYFNGGLFSKVEAIDLREDELLLIGGHQDAAAMKDWSKVDPAIFGTIFQHSMDAEKRHAYGAHYTHESDIMRIVGPTIVRPWLQRIDTAKTQKELIQLRAELTKLKVLDPACGSGNFLYVTYREMVRLETRILFRLEAMMKPKEFNADFKSVVTVSPRQFFELELDSFGADLAKLTLMVAKKLATDEARKALNRDQNELGYGDADVLPLDNLDTNILSQDALFNDWPESDVVIGNPPYQSKNKLQEEMGLEYTNRLRDAFPDIDGRSDYCVYWFRKAHDHLKAGQRAGLVGTNTVRQNYTRESGLDYITANGGTITEAVSSMIWPDEAAVHVSIVNWVKGKQKGPKRLYVQEGNDKSEGWRHEDFEVIGPSLSFNLDVTQAKSLVANTKGGCFQGQTHGHAGFLMARDRAKLHLNANPKDSEVLRPFLIANDLIGAPDSKSKRYVIDFHKLDIHQAEKHKVLFKLVEQKVLPTRKAAAEKEIKRNKAALQANAKARINHHHENFLNRWWVLSYPREEMINRIEKMQRYIVCGQVTKRPIFEFLDSAIRPNAALMVFTHDDDYSFGILQSSLHWNWFINRCSTLTERFRYTSNTVFDSFPWPQNPSAKQIEDVAAKAKSLRGVRNKLRGDGPRSLRDIYRTLEKPGKNIMRDAHEALDAAVVDAYGMKKTAEPLDFLLTLNASLAKIESDGGKIVGPGLPETYTIRSKLVSADCVKN